MLEWGANAVQMLCYAALVHIRLCHSLLPPASPAAAHCYPLLHLPSDAAVQKQVEQSIEQFKKANNGRVPNLDECEVSAGKVATAALLGNNSDQNSQVRLQGKVHDECLQAQLNGNGGGKSK